MNEIGFGCCNWLRGLLKLAGEKGFSVIAFRDGDHRAFYVQARPFERDVIEKYSQIDQATGHARWPQLTNPRGGLEPYVESMDLYLRYCPSCAANLGDLIKKDTSAFDALAEAMSRFRPPA